MLGGKKLLAPIQNLTANEAKRYMSEHKEGEFTLLDVRQPREYEKEHLPGATLIPLPNLRDAGKQLDPNKPTIVYCAAGNRSQAASRLLSGLGFEVVYNLQGGIRAWHGQKAVGPQELSLDLVSGDESPVEMVAITYGMEMSQGIFYRRLISQSEDPELRELAAKLAAVEAQHKSMLLALLGDINPPRQSAETYEADIQPTVLEGGFDLQEFFERNQPHLRSALDALNLAMMLETQALDLYLRFARICTDAATRDLLFALSDGEKAHLDALGRLLEEKL